jgi:hypothetical protein
MIPNASLARMKVGKTTASIFYLGIKYNVVYCYIDSDNCLN